MTHIFVWRNRDVILISTSSLPSPGMGTYSDLAVRYVMPSECILMIVLPAYRISCLRSFAGILLTSPLREAETAAHERLVRESDVRDTLKHVSLKQIAGIECLTQRSVLVCAYSDECVQPLVCSTSNTVQHYQRSENITEQRKQACLGRTRWLQAHNSA